MTDADRWSLFAAHALQGLLAAPLGSIAPERVVGSEDMVKIAVSFADALVVEKDRRFYRSGLPLQPSDVRPAAPHPSSEEAAKSSAGTGAARGELLTYEQYVALATAESQGK